jgi:single-strand DNA-binding protein
MNETTITVSGNLVSDVDFRVTSRGDALARFRLASTPTRYDQGSGRWVDGNTAYWNVTAWRRAAENARASLAKGLPVVVQGRVRQRTVDREVPGVPGATMPVTFTDLEAQHFGLDLSRCRAVYQRAPIGPQTGAGSDPTPDGGGSGVGGPAVGMSSGGGPAEESVPAADAPGAGDAAPAPGEHHETAQVAGEVAA